MVRILIRPNRSLFEPQMIYYICYDAHADRGRKWASTDRRWRISFSRDKERVKRHDETCWGILMHSNGDLLEGFTTFYASCKPLKKNELPKPCQEALDKFLENDQTEEVL